MPKDIDAPSFQFYPDDFASDGKVEAMTTEEVGAYMLLLCKAWREKPPATIPNDDQVLARWTRLGDRWPECKLAVLRPWKLLKGGARYVQPRLKREYDKMIDRRRQAHTSATVAANKRWEYERKMRRACVLHAPGIDDAMRNDAIPSSSSIPSSAAANAASAAALALDQDEGEERLVAEGFDSAEARRLVALWGYPQVEVAIANANFLARVGKLESRKNYIAAAITDRYALRDEVGREQIQSEKKAKSIISAQRREEERQRQIAVERQREAEINAAVDSCPPEELQALITEFKASRLTKSNKEPDLKTNAALRAFIAERRPAEEMAQ